MKKSILAAFAAVLAFALAGCATTSGASSSNSSGSGSTVKQAAINALTGAGKNVWYKTVNGNYVYYILYSDHAVTSGVRSDVAINKGLTILVTTSSANPVNGLASNTFAVKSFGQTSTESSNGSAQTFTLNDGTWSYFYAKNSALMTAVSGLPAQLRSANAARYTNVTSLTASSFDWKQILLNYLEGSL